MSPFLPSWNTPLYISHRLFYLHQNHKSSTNPEHKHRSQARPAIGPVECYGKYFLHIKIYRDCNKYIETETNQAPRL